MRYKNKEQQMFFLRPLHLVYRRQATVVAKFVVAVGVSQAFCQLAHALDNGLSSNGNMFARSF